MFTAAFLLFLFCPLDKLDSHRGPVCTGVGGEKIIILYNHDILHVDILTHSEYLILLYFITEF